MKRNTSVCSGVMFAAFAMTAAVSGAALANRGGGGDSGDSSMNPFTGDSYAYFHGGHNLGEQGTIRPNRVPPRRDLTRNPEAPGTPAADASANDRAADANANALPDRPVHR